MNKYGKVAIHAVNLIQSNEVNFVDEAWEIATAVFFTTATKACPRSAFIGLCEAGLVKGINQNHIKHPLKSSINKDHAIEAIKLISENESLSSYKSLDLWRTVMKGNPKSHNFQMDVVLALWNNSMIVLRSQKILTA